MPEEPYDSWEDVPRYVPVLCPEKHREAVEAYIADLESVEVEHDERDGTEAFCR